MFAEYRAVSAELQTCVTVCAPAQEAAARQDARIAQLTASCQRLGAELAVREDALAGALSRLAIADLLLHTPPDGDPARVPGRPFPTVDRLAVRGLS